MPEIYKEKSEQSLTDKELRENQEIRDKSREKLAKSLENSGERDQEKEQSIARHEALELANTKERRTNKNEKTPKIERQRGVNTKTERKRAFNAILSETQSKMSAPARSFSKIIHNPAIEKTSEVIGATIARPNSILAGSVSAFVVVLGIYFIARFFAYPLSGSETLAAFALGWVVGIIYDFFHTMITGRTS